MSKRKTWPGRIYLGRDEGGKQRFHWVGRFPTRRERDEAVAEARIALKRGGSALLPLCDEYADRYLADYDRRNKASSAHVQRERLRPFRKDFAGRSLDIPRAEAKAWALENPWSVPAIVSLYNYAIDEDDVPLGRNPFRKLSSRGPGRSKQAPPTEEEFRALLDGCGALGHYGQEMRSLVEFATFTLMRPSELYTLERSDIDFERMRIHKARRLYRGEVAEPKTGPKLIALTPPARDAIIGLPVLDHLVFHSKTGKRLSQPALSLYWREVQAASGLTFDFYHATKHYGVHFMWTKLGMSRRAIAAQAGWELRTVDEMLAIYGHGEVGALDEVDAAFASENVVRLRAVGE